MPGDTITFDRLIAAPERCLVIVRATRARVDAANATTWTADCRQVPEYIGGRPAMLAALVPDEKNIGKHSLRLDFEPTGEARRSAEVMTWTPNNSRRNCLRCCVWHSRIRTILASRTGDRDWLLCFNRSPSRLWLPLTARGWPHEMREMSSLASSSIAWRLRRASNCCRFSSAMQNSRRPAQSRPIPTRGDSG